MATAPSALFFRNSSLLAVLARLCIVTAGEADACVPFTDNEYWTTNMVRVLILLVLVLVSYVIYPGF
jgi:hypothetical protein